MVQDNPDIDAIVSVFAGKFRRYHGESLLHRLLDVKTNLLNLRDVFYVLLGLVQALFIVKKLKPDVVFLKGGFVGVPIGLASAFWRKRIVTHDSDAVPGLANRLVGRWASVHATAMPSSYYKYPEKKVRHVGVLVGPQYVPVTQKIQMESRKQLGLPEEAQVIMVTGGSGGAQNINYAIAQVAPEVLNVSEKLYIVHQVGIGKGNVYVDYHHERLKVFELLKDMYKYSAAADIVITRAGATTIAEFGVQGKACVVVPNPLLTGGHQTKNAEYLLQEDAALIVGENLADHSVDPDVLWSAVTELLNNPTKRNKLASNLQKITISDASERLAVLLLSAAEA